MPLWKHFRFCLWWESFFNGGHFSTCQTRKKSTPVTFFLHMRHVFLRPGVISLRRKMTPRSIFDGGRHSSLHRHPEQHGPSQERLVTSQRTTQEDHHRANQPIYTHADAYKGPEVTQQHPMTNQTHFLSKGRANTETSHQAPTSPRVNQHLLNRYRINPCMMHQAPTVRHPKERSTVSSMGTHPIQNMTQQTQRDICIPTWKYYEGPRCSNIRYSYGTIRCFRPGLPGGASSKCHWQGRYSDQHLYIQHTRP